MAHTIGGYYLQERARPRFESRQCMSQANQRFTLDGSEALEQQLQQTCDLTAATVRQAVGSSLLEGLLLGGGYGRGEGGVLRTPTGDKPYNDLEFYVLVKGSLLLAERRLKPTLHRAAHSLGRYAGVEVEFKVCSLRQLRISPTTMFYYDLVQGHRWVIGDEQLLQSCQHHRDPARIPPFEAARLLLNRCSGLLFGAERLTRQPWNSEHADFVGRNLAKLQLGLGDAVLALHGRYHWSCLERHRRLRSLPFLLTVPWGANVLEQHGPGVEFKLHPVQTNQSAQDLAIRHQELRRLGEQVWLWLESNRLQTQFSSISDYPLPGVVKCPETSPAKNILINLRSLGWRALSGAYAVRYPRERLFNSLALLLFRPELDEQSLAKVRQALGTRQSTFPELVAAYQALWQQFN